MGIVGWTIARYGALVAGEVVTGDAIAFAFSTGALVLLYSLALLVLLPLDATWPQRALPLLLLAVTTHVVVVRRGPFLDRLLYGRAGGALRAQLGALTERVVRQPDTLSALADARETVGALVRSPEPETEGQTAGPAGGGAGQPARPGGGGHAPPERPPRPEREPPPRPSAGAVLARAPSWSGRRGCGRP